MFRATPYAPWINPIWRQSMIVHKGKSDRERDRRKEKHYHLCLYLKFNECLLIDQSSLKQL